MTSCMQFEKIEGWSFWTGISVKGWRRIGQVRRYKKERNVTQVNYYVPPHLGAALLCSSRAGSRFRACIQIGLKAYCHVLKQTIWLKLRELEHYVINLPCRDLNIGPPQWQAAVLTIEL